MAGFSSAGFSPTERAYLALQRRLKGKNPLPRADLAPFELTKMRERGEYLGSFGATRFEGVYSFVVRLEGLTPKCQPFLRELNFSVAVLPDPDPQRTDVKPTWEDRDPDKGLTVTVTPVVTAGHLMGPGHASGIRIAADNVLKPTSGVVDNADGSYTQSFQVVEKGPVKLGVRVLGTGLRPVALNIALPAVLSVKPTRGRNDALRTIVVSLDEGADASRVKGILLTDGKRGIRLRDFRLDEEQRTAQADIPRGVQPGSYSVVLWSARGRGPRSKGVTFEVVGESGR